MDEKMKKWLDDHRLVIIVGHSGSGKTELSVNLALTLAESGEKTALADLDVVNPYFRSRERADILNEKNVRLICSSQRLVDADVPSMPSELNVLFDDKSYRAILDIGGDAAGARVLSRYRPRLQKTSYGVLFVINASRPLTSTAEDVIRYMGQIENMTGLKITGIVNNTHMCQDTNLEYIIKGIQVAHEVSEITGIPVIGHAIEETFIPAAETMTVGTESVIPLRLYMKKPWE